MTAGANGSSLANRRAGQAIGRPCRPVAGRVRCIPPGTINESGPYYGFWSGFGSDLEEFGILGGISAAIYQLVKKHNCHEPGCWRIGQYPAADGQFVLCYGHHPDFQGRKPTHELIERLHREHRESQAALRGKLHKARDHRTPGQAAAHDPPGDARPGATRLGAARASD